MLKRVIAISLATVILTGFLGVGVVSGSGQGNGGNHVISALGITKVHGQDVIVDVLVVVQHGEDEKEAAHRALEAQGAKPFEPATLGSAGFTVEGFKWAGASTTQNYNNQNEPVSAEDDLQTTEAAWSNVATSKFKLNYGGLTDRCPSLVRECSGPQYFDGKNDVAWLQLAGGNTLGVTWYGTSTTEADMALNTFFQWKDNCSSGSGYDAQTVFLHENGHVVGLGHSSYPSAVMYPSYQGVRCSLALDDKEGVTYLYDNEITGSVSGYVKDGNGNGIGGATVVLKGTSLKATTAADGSYTISNVPDPVTYDVTATKGKKLKQTVRTTVDHVTIVDFTL